MVHEWAAIPDQYHTLVKVKHGGFEVWFRSRDLYARRLTLAPDNTTGQAVLLLEGQQAGAGVMGLDLELIVDHPYAAAAANAGTPGTYGDQSGWVYRVENAKVFILGGFGRMGRGVLEKHRKLYKELGLSGAAAGSEPLWGETLGLIAFNYLAQLSQADDLAARLSKSEVIHHHTLGVVMRKKSGGKEVLVLDLGLCRSSQVAWDGDPARVIPGFLAYADRGSVLESGVLEQNQDFGGMSATKALDLAVSEGQRIFKATPDNWDQIVSDLDLMNTSPALYEKVNEMVAAGRHVIIPAADQMAVDHWTGYGAVAAAININGYTDWTNVMYLLGGLKGASCAGDETGTCLAAYSEANQDEPDCPGDKGPGPNPLPYAQSDVAAQPIDMSDGRFFHEYMDLTEGAGLAALSFHRSYYSSNRFDDHGLGYGWGHNHAAGISLTTDGFQGLGEHSAFKAAAAVAAFYAAFDLLSENQNLDRIVLSALIHAWLMEQLTHNTVTVSFPGGSKQFYRYPDGSFGTESCCGPEELGVEADGSFRVIDRNQVVYDFDLEGRLEKRTDPNGNTLTYGYDGEGRLASISNSFGRSLALAWTDGRISQVSGAGRSAPFGSRSPPLNSDPCSIIKMRRGWATSWPASWPSGWRWTCKAA
ncbi:MAG: DUF6531 domain-containing protein [Thermodesulfobacteriota bacterium]